MMKQILKEAFDKANDIVTRYERYQMTLREKVDMLDDLSKETETKIKNSMIVVNDISEESNPLSHVSKSVKWKPSEIWKLIKIVLLKSARPVNNQTKLTMKPQQFEKRKERAKAIIRSLLITLIVTADTYFTQKHDCPSPIFSSIGTLADWFFLSWLITAFVLYYIKRFLYHLASI